MSRKVTLGGNPLCRSRVPTRLLVLSLKPVVSLAWTARFREIATQELHWLPKDLRIKFKILLHTYKGLHGHAPGYITDMLDIYTPTRTLRSTDSLTLVVPKLKTITYGERHFKYAAARLWNHLPNFIRETNTLSQFKKSLKTHLFQTHYAP